MQQLENEKKMLLDRKRREQEERRRKQDELERILQENRQKVSLLDWQSSACMQPVLMACTAPRCSASRESSDINVYMLATENSMCYAALH